MSKSVLFKSYRQNSTNSDPNLKLKSLKLLKKLCFQEIQCYV